MPSADCFTPERAATTYYIGNENPDIRRTGYGLHRWQNPKWLHRYVGQFFLDCMHGEGSYKWYRNYRKLPDEPHISYEGNFYANDLEGYGHLSFTEGSSFEGLFKQNQLFGPGILTDADGKQNVGFWHGCSLIRLSQVLPGIPHVAQSPSAKAKLLRFKRLLDIDEATSVVDVALNTMSKVGAPQRVAQRYDQLYNADIRDRRSMFFNEPAFKEACCFERPVNCDARTDIFVDVDLDEPRKGRLKDVEVVYKNKNMAVEATSTDGLVDKVMKEDAMKRKAIADLKGSNAIVPVRNVKRVKATHLVAWNNENRMMEMLLHVFLHRYHEPMISFDIKKMLRGERESFKEAGVSEKMNTQFLEMCAFGLDKEVYEMIAAEGVDLNVADGRGNTGLFFAVAGDHEEVIRVLLNEGANINQENDEGFTPLTLAITRYLAVLYKVKNWEFAFLPPNSQLTGMAAPESVMKWGARESAQMFHFGLDMEDEMDDDDLLQRYLLQLDKLKKGKGKQKTGAKLLVRPRRKFVLSLAPLPPLPPPQKLPKSRSPSPSKKKKNKKKKQKEEQAEPVDPDKLSEEELAKLQHIEVTIRLLLSLGAQVNTGEVPLSPLALSMFTKNEGLTQLLLDTGARPNDEVLAYGGGITPLHIVSLMTPDGGLVRMAKMLLDNGADPTAMTQSEYDLPTKEFVLGGLKLSKQDDGGRTPLHTLLLRADVNQDKDKHLTNVLDLLLQDATSVTKRYLNYTPLALAVLRGNADLVERMLDTRRIDPNEVMEGGLGTALTVLASKKCKKHLPLQVAKKMCDDLLKYGADPLRVMSLEHGVFRGNAVDFANKEVDDAMDFIKSQKKLEKKKKKVLMEEYKELKALASHIELKAARLLERRAQSEFTQMFYKKLKAGGYLDPQDEYYYVRPLKHKPRGLRTAKEWLTKQDLIRCVALLSNENKMEVTKDEAFTMLTMLGGSSSSNSNSSRRRLKIASMEKDIETYLTPFLKPPRNQREMSLRAKWKMNKNTSLKKDERTGSKSLARELTLPDAKMTTIDLVQSPFMTHPEVDDDDNKFEACFECGRKVGRLLQYCPKCKAVAFCSLKCNEANIKRSTVHKCSFKFYGDPAYTNIGRTIIGKWNYGSDEDISTIDVSDSDEESSSGIESKTSKTSKTSGTTKTSRATKSSKQSMRSIGGGGAGYSQAGSDVSRWRGGDGVTFIDGEEYQGGESGRKKKSSKHTTSEGGSEDMFGIRQKGESYVKKSRFSAAEPSEADTESIIIITKKKSKKKKTKNGEEGEDGDDDDSEEDDILRKAMRGKVKSGKKTKRDKEIDEDIPSKKAKKAKSDVEDLEDKDGASKLQTDKKKKAKGGEIEGNKGGRADSKSKKINKQKDEDDAFEEKKGGKAKSKSTKETKAGDVDLGRDNKATGKSQFEKVKQNQLDKSDEAKAGKSKTKSDLKTKTERNYDKIVKTTPMAKGGKNVKGEITGVKGAEKAGKNTTIVGMAKKGVSGKGDKNVASKEERRKGAEQKAVKADKDTTKSVRGKSRDGRSRGADYKTFAESQAQKKEEEKLKFIDKYGREVTMTRIGNRGEHIKEKVKLFPEHLRIYLLQACQNLGLDLDNLMLPYTVLRDGQLYYRLYGPEPLFTENYSLI